MGGALDPIRALGRPDRGDHLRRSRLVQYPVRAGAEGIHSGIGLRRQERPGQARRADRGLEETVRAPGRRPPSRSWKGSSFWPGARSARPSSSSRKRPRCGPRLWPAPIWRPATMGSPRAPRGRPSKRTPTRFPPWPPRSRSSTRAGKEKEAREAYQVARAARPLGRPRSAGFPPPGECRLPLEGRGNLDRAQPPSRPMPSGTDETAIDRIDLKTLGPLVWSPFPAEAFSRTDTAGGPGTWPLTRARTSSSSSSWAGSAPIACSSFKRSARNTRPSRN